DIATNTLSYGTTLDGVTHGTFTLTGDNARPTLALVNQMADELHDQAVRDHQHCPELAIPPRSTLLALALVELVRRGSAVDLDSSTPPKAEMELVVHQDHDGTVFDDHGHRVDNANVSLWFCAARLHAVVVNSLGVPVDMGREIRLANRAQRRAIHCRDGGCVFPGCDLPIAWLDIHHAHWWDNGGTTDIANLCGLCRFHHGVAHRNGWHLHMDPNGWVWFQTPTGT